MDPRLARAVAANLIAKHDTHSDGVADVLRPNFTKKPHWFVVWKREGKHEFRLYFREFGVFDSAEAAMGTVEMSLKGNPVWKKECEHGVFYPIPAHMCLPVKFVR